MRMSDLIEEFIKELFEEGSEAIEIQRNELAQQFNCVPSQINYVISTRFGPQSGYIVRSRRGGGGYVMIRRAEECPAISESVAESEAVKFAVNLFNRGIITQREAAIIRAAVTSVNLDNKTRADILKNILRSVPLGEEVL